MAEYQVTYSCGHTEMIEVFGKPEERSRKVARCGIEICSACSRKKKQAQLDLLFEKVTMPYSEYQEHYSDCKAIYDSYDESEKTIVVYVRRKEIQEAEKEKIVKSLEYIIGESLNAVADKETEKEYLDKTKITIEHIRKSDALFVCKDFGIYTTAEVKHFDYLRQGDRKIHPHPEEDALKEFATTVQVAYINGRDYKNGPVIE